MSNHASQYPEHLEELRQALILELRRSAGAHVARRYEELGCNFDRIDALVWRIEPRKLLQTTLEYRAYSLLDSWLDAYNHDWFPYDILEGDWPKLGSHMADVLEGTREFDESEFHGVC